MKYNKTKIIGFIGFLSILIFTLCSKNDNDNYIEVIKVVPEVNTIEIYDNINLVLHSDTLFETKIVAPDYLINEVFIDTINGALQLENRNRNKWKYYLDMITKAIDEENPLSP